MGDKGLQLIDVLNNFVRATNEIKKITEESNVHEEARKNLVKKFKGKDSIPWEQAQEMHDLYTKFLNKQEEIEDLLKKLEIATTYLKLHLQAFGKLALVFEYDHGDPAVKEKVFVKIFINKKGEIEFSNV